MGLLDQIEARILDALKRLFAPVIGPLTRLWNILKSMVTAIIDLIPATIHLVHTVVDEIQAWRTFREQINFKTGVVNLQSAKDRILDLYDEAIDAWHSIVDLVSGGFKQATTKPFQDAADAAAELADLFEGFSELGIRDFFSKIGSKIERAGGKILEVLAIIETVAESLLHVVNDLQTIVDAVTDIRKTFQTGEGLFLQQNNKRRIVGLSGGGSIKVRVGKLHS